MLNHSVLNNHAVFPCANPHSLLLSFGHEAAHKAAFASGFPMGKNTSEFPLRNFYPMFFLSHAMWVINVNALGSNPAPYKQQGCMHAQHTEIWVFAIALCYFLS